MKTIYSNALLFEDHFVEIVVMHSKCELLSFARTMLKVSLPCSLLDYHSFPGAINPERTSIIKIGVEI